MRDGAKLLRARELRRDATFAEKRLWEQLRGKKLGGYKVVRQEPVGPFIVDFVCRTRRFIVEVDGETHATDEELAYDRRRSDYLVDEGYRIVRVQNDDVINAMDGVLHRILETLEQR
jgi:very-short-patch-repair endonuclease